MSSILPNSQEEEMNINKKLEHTHSHMWLVGVAGVAAGVFLMIYVPSIKAISRTLLLFAGFHLVGAVVLLASFYVMAGRATVHWLRPKAKREAAGFYFGWAPAWTYGPWIASLILAASGVLIQVAAPALWPLAMVLILLAAGEFAGGLATRSAGRYTDALLPAVDLLSNDDSLVLDAGCGAGRTTIALGRAYKKVHIVDLDRFDSDYIDGGGLRLLEGNLRLAGMTELVRIERGDLTSLPFEDDSFDAVVSAHAIDHLGRQKEQGLREAMRVLKPGGRLLLIVWVPSWTMFAVANILALSLSPKRAWRRMAANVGFTMRDEGNFNGVWFALLKKEEA
jgi:SAM-dependent methyltransferase